MKRRGRGATELHSPARIKAVLRGERALQLRIEGSTFEEIARELGYRSTSSAYEAVDRALKQHPSEADADILRSIQNERLDALLKAVLPKALQGDLAAIDRVLAIETLRARINGTFAPAQQHIKAEISANPYDGLSDQERIRQLDAILNAARQRALSSGLGLIDGELPDTPME